VEKEGPRFDVFDGSGRFLGNVLVKDGVFPFRMLPWVGGFWVVKATEDDDFSVVKYGIEALRRP
jgi:Ser/Thr protein kinase RdoA (MazF antagonist)